jgi:putative oxidoreductase
LSSADIAALVLRLTVGTIFIVQGWQKTFAPAGAKGSGASLREMISARGLPAPGSLAQAVAIVELVGGALILVGFATRFAAFPLAITLVVAIVLFKWKEGFQGGWDWPLSVLAATLALMLTGAGSLSVDHLLRFE